MKVGKITNGLVKTDNQKLYPEEALYLIERNQLELQEFGVPMSQQQAKSTLKIDQDIFQVYCHLTQKGYDLKRTCNDNLLYESNENVSLEPLYNVTKKSKSISQGLGKSCLIVSNDKMIDFAAIPIPAASEDAIICCVFGSDLQFLTTSIKYKC
jgi:hypothetical protein